MKASILLYNFQDKSRKEQLKRMLLVQHLAIKEIAKEDYLDPIGFHAGAEGIEPSENKYEGEELDGEMMIFAGMTGEQVDSVLMGFRKHKLPRVNYKAVLTPTNQFWNAVELFQELKREHEAFHKK